MASMEILDTSTGIIRIATTTDLGGGGGGGGASSDRELVTVTYRVKTAFAGASVGDVITQTQVIDVTATPTTITTLWRNQTTAADLVSAPSLVNLETVGAEALTNDQLRAAGIPVIPSNITAKFRDSFEGYTPGSVYAETKADGDIIQTEGNAIASSWLDFSLDPLTAGTESSITTNAAFSMPVEVATGLSMSQRTLGQEFSVEVISDEAPLPVEPDQPILNIQQTTTTLTINFANPHGLVPGKCFGIFGVSDSRLNYPSLVVASTPTPTQITATAGPSGNIPSVTAGPFTSGSIYIRSRLGYARDGVSQIFENVTATNSSIYFRSDAGDSLPSGTANGHHSVTTSSTASVQAINAAATYAFQPTTEFRIVLQADRVQVSDAAIDSTAQSNNRLSRTQVVPNPSKSYKLRIRATNNKGLTVPTAQIVSAVKTGTTTATITCDRPHGLTAADVVVVYGIRDQAAASFPNLVAATAISNITANTFNVVIGTASTVTSYGGYVAKVQGSNVMAALGQASVAVQSAAVSTLVGGQKILTLVGNTNWSGFVIGDRVNCIGIRDAVSGASLNLDGVYRVRNFATTTVDLEPIGTTTLPADFVAVNCGGAIIKRTSLRLHYLRIFDYERQRVEMLARPGADGASAIPVNIQNTAPVTVSSGSIAPTASTNYFLNSTASTNGALVSSATTGVQSVFATNTGAAVAYVKLYNKVTAPTVGTDVPEMIIPVPAAVGGVPGVSAPIDCGFSGMRFPLGLGIATTGGAADADTTAVAAGQVKVKISRTA